MAPPTTDPKRKPITRQSVISLFWGLLVLAVVLILVSCDAYRTQVANPGCAQLADQLERLRAMTSLASRAEIDKINAQNTKRRFVWDVDVDNVSRDGELSGRCYNWPFMEKPNLKAIPWTVRNRRQFEKLEKAHLYRVAGYPYFSDKTGRPEVTLIVEDVWGTGGTWGCARIPTTWKIGADGVRRPMPTGHTDYPWCD